MSISPIISEELWQAVLERKSLNSRDLEHNRKAAYLLSGMVSCLCGRRMTSVTHKWHTNHKAYYKCQAMRSTTRAETPALKTGAHPGLLA